MIDFPAGQGEYPASGISWYEAAAYAEFAGKSLPTGYHWGIARGTPPEHKRLKLYETDHIPPINEMIKETLAWLNLYLGPVR